MIERERLIRLLNNSLTGSVGLSSMLSENIADYLLANGVIVPPCSVKDEFMQESKLETEENPLLKNIEKTEKRPRTVFLTYHVFLMLYNADTGDLCNLTNRRFFMWFFGNIY